MFGKTSRQKQRFKCLQCNITYVRKRKDRKIDNEQRWFQLWVTESYSIRQLSNISRHSEFKLKQIKNYWLNQRPKKINDFKKYKYLIYDGTYFHETGCLLKLMHVEDQAIIDNVYAQKEGYLTAHPWFLQLKQQGLNPRFITMDGEISTMRAVKDVWPKTKIQRCLYHIQRESLRWLRTYPKTQAGKDLKRLIMGICSIQSKKEKEQFIKQYKLWLDKYEKVIKKLPKDELASKDLKRTIVLLNNAIPNMFHYLDNKNIKRTTNALEDFHSRLKSDYQKHLGLTEKHKISYLKWYCFFKNGLN